MASFRCRCGGCVVALLLRQLLESFKLRLLILSQMRQMPRGVLHRFDSLEVRHVLSRVRESEE